MELSQTLSVPDSSQRLRCEDGISKKSCNAQGALARVPVKLLGQLRERHPTSVPVRLLLGHVAATTVRPADPTCIPLGCWVPHKGRHSLLPLRLLVWHTLELLKARHSVRDWHLFSCWRWRDAQRGSTWSQASQCKWCALLQIYLQIYLHSLYVLLPLSHCRRNGF